MTIFTPLTLEQLGVVAEAALHEGRAAGFGDWDTRERFLQAAAKVYDVSALLLPGEDTTGKEEQP